MKTLYVEKGKKMFYHENIIFISNYFIKKIREAEHIYIDGTFVYPKGFTQLIIILYYDSKADIVCPGLFGLINNKTQSGYILLFQSIKNIISIENTKHINIKSCTLDFEKAL